MAANWRRCQQCRKVLPVEDFDGDSPVCRADVAKANAPVTGRTKASAVTTRTVQPAPTLTPQFWALLPAFLPVVLVLVAENVGHIRGRGLLAGVEIVADRATKEPDGALATKVVGACKRNGLIVGRNAETAAGLDNVLALSPPLNLTEDDLDFIVDGLAKGLAEATAA